MDLRAKLLPILVLILVVGGSLAGRQIILDRQKIAALSKPAQQLVKEEVAALVAKVSKLVVLPTGEDPTIATVTDKTKLKDQPAFANAQNGDQILIYVGAKKAYIYSPSQNKIVDVVAVNIASIPPTILGVSAENPLKVALYNGTTTSGLTNTLEQRINDAKIVGLLVVAKDTAKKNDYAKTEVIDLTGKLAEQVKQLATLLNGEVVSSAAGEISPKADVLVIIGADFK